MHYALVIEAWDKISVAVVILGANSNDDGGYLLELVGY